MSMKASCKFISAIALLSLVACGDDSSSNSTNDEPESSSDQAVDPSSSETDPAKMFNVRVPNQESYVCESPIMETSETIAEHDIICTFKVHLYAGYSHFLLRIHAEVPRYRKS